MEFIDTHTHIYGEEFLADIDDVIARARQAGALRLMLPNVDEASIEPMFALCERYPDLCFPMMGLQPEELPADPEPLLRRMEDILRTRPVKAVGEVGIDLYWDASRREEQIRVLRREVEWAVAYALPLVIHCRAAHRDLCDTLSIYKERLTRGGIFHCFGGTAEEARELLAFPGFCLGIGGVLTFRKSALPDVLAEAVPLERIVVETDAPYLTPVPHRGERNEPAYIPFVLQKLADVYGVSVDEVARTTTRNAEKIFFPEEK